MNTKYLFTTLVSVIGHWAKWVIWHAAPKLKKFFSTKIPIWGKLESDDYKLTRFPFDWLDDDNLCLCNLLGKEQLGVKLPDTSSRDTADSFVTS